MGKDKKIKNNFILAVVMIVVFIGMWNLMAYKDRVCDEPIFSIHLEEGKIIGSNLRKKYTFYRYDPNAFSYTKDFTVDSQLKLGKTYQCKYKNYPFICWKEKKLYDCQEIKSIERKCKK